MKPIETKIFVIVTALSLGLIFPDPLTAYAPWNDNETMQVETGKAKIRVKKKGKSEIRTIPV